MPRPLTMFLSTLEKRNSEGTRLMRPETPPWTCCSSPSPESPARTTLSTVRSRNLPFRATDKLMEVTTLTPRLSARLSTSAQLTGPEVSPSTASSAPTEPSSTKTTSFATGGSTLTAPPLRISTASMTRSPLRGTLWPEPLTRPSMAPPQNTARPLPPSETMTLASEVTRTPGGPPGGCQATGEAQEAEEAADEAMEGEDKLEPHRSGPGEPSHRW